MKLRVYSLLIVTLTILTLTQACSRPLAPQPACNFVQNPELQRVSWNSKVPVKFYLHSSVPVEAYPAIDRAVQEYNEHLAGGKEVIRIVARGVSGDLSPLKDGYSVVYWFDRWETNRQTEQARTTIYWSGSQIFESDIRVNADDFQYSYGESTIYGKVDLTSLMVHEFGHALGLGHTSNRGSVMVTSLGDGENRRKLSDTDLANLRCEYNSL